MVLSFYEKKYCSGCFELVFRSWVYLKRYFYAIEAWSGLKESSFHVFFWGALLVMFLRMSAALK